MMRKNKVNEVFRQPLTENGLEIKKAIINDERIIEHVFATNMKNVRRDGNRYYFQYPGEWLTSRMKHIIGVRGLYLVKANRTFSMIVNLYDGNNKEIVNIPFFPTFITKNDSVFTFFEKFNDVIFNNECVKPYKIYLHCVYVNNVLLINQMNLDDKYKNYYYKITFANDIVKYIQLRDDIIKNSIDDIVISFKDTNKHAFHILFNRCDDIEVRASFVKQTEYQHLGFTNNLYTPLKQYELECADNEFWIDLYTNDQINQVFLPDDNKDMIVIETQLILKP